MNELTKLIMIQRVLIWAVAIITVACAEGPQVQRSEPLSDEAVIIEAAEFDKESIEKLARGLVARTEPNIDIDNMYIHLLDVGWYSFTKKSASDPGKPQVRVVFVDLDSRKLCYRPELDVNGMPTNRYSEHDARDTVLVQVYFDHEFLTSRISESKEMDLRRILNHPPEYPEFDTSTILEQCFEAPISPATPLEEPKCCCGAESAPEPAR